MGLVGSYSVILIELVGRIVGRIVGVNNLNQDKRSPSIVVYPLSYSCRQGNDIAFSD